MKYNSYNKHLYIRPDIKDLENGLNYKSPRKNAKDKLCFLDANNVSTKESQDTLNALCQCKEKIINKVLEAY